MINSKLADELNKQITIELESAYLYLSAAAYFDSRSLEGISRWMQIQAQEELQHAMKVYGYLNDQGCRVKLEAIPQPQTEFSSAMEAFELALKQEKDLYERFNNLSEMAREIKDNATYIFLQWFLTEQVEEVASVSGIIDKINLIGESGHGLLMLDSTLGSRPPISAEDSN